MVTEVKIETYFFSRLANWKDIQECIDACNFYYFQSIARNALFHNALCAPSRVSFHVIFNLYVSVLTL